MTPHESRRDVSPPGWQHTTEKMKSHGEISNPFALAWWMSEQGFHPHDAENKDTLDVCNEMFEGSGMHAKEDGATYTSAGAKAPAGEPNSYEAKTENLEPFEEEEMYDADDNALNQNKAVSPEGPGAYGEAVHSHGAGHSPAGHGKVADDDDEALLDDSEGEAGDPVTQLAVSDPAVKSAPEGVHSNIGDPMPDDMGSHEFGVEGEEVNDDDDDDDDLMY